MADKKASDGVPVVAINSEGAGTVAVGDHTAADLEGTYRDNPDKPAEDSIAQVQDVPEGWPGVRGSSESV
jgi:hypothetical protein